MTAADTEGSAIPSFNRPSAHCCFHGFRPPGLSKAHIGILKEVVMDDAQTPSGSTVDMKFEIVVIPVSDVDRAKAFYQKLGWRLDADFASGDDFRVLQFTPPGSGCSVIFGRNVTAAAPG